MSVRYNGRVYSMFAPIQWETSLQNNCNGIPVMASGVDCEGIWYPKVYEVGADDRNTSESKGTLRPVCPICRVGRMKRCSDINWYCWILWHVQLHYFHNCDCKSACVVTLYDARTTTRVLGEALFIGCIWRHDYHEWSNEWKQRNVMMPTLWSLATPKWGQSWHHDSFLMNVLHNNIFIPTAHFIMTSILMRLILIGCINLTPTKAEIGSNISTTEVATTITNRSSSADMTSKYVPKWLKWFVRSDNMTTITLRDDHNMTVLPARSFALWPETQVRK